MVPGRVLAGGLDRSGAIPPPAVATGTIRHARVERPCGLWDRGGDYLAERSAASMSSIAMRVR
jgi:hypothetical protein